jgi:D-alanyl-D-alanine carboxypeptidase
MPFRTPARTVGDPARSIILAGLVVVSAGLVDILADRSRVSFAVASSFPASSPSDVPRGHPPRAIGEADGVIPSGTTVFADGIPGVANLDPALLAALRQAATHAADDGVEFVVNSGWRSPAYEERLLDEAVSKYGSREEAARWVATAETSAHVSGDAVDIGPSRATTWLSEHGARYGLCQIYSNEAWHYELRPEAINRGCPARYADPAADPRMRP